MAKSYSGLDKTEAFFAHYGRKGMKRGMNIFNPNYKPIGEKAQGTSDGKIVQRSISAKPTTYKAIGEKAQGVIRRKSDAINIGDKFATPEERAAFKEAVKENEKATKNAKKFNEYKKDGAKMVEQLGGDNVSERDFRTIVRSYQEVFSIINKALGLKVAEPDNFADDKTSSDDKKLKEALVENYARFIEYAKGDEVSGKEEAIESAMKNSSMEDATKVRSLIAKDREQSKIKRLGKLREKNRREALMEAERKRQAAIDRR